MQDLTAKLFAELKRDKKKSAIMISLLAVGLVLVARLALSRPGPAPAAAETTAQAPSRSVPAEADASVLDSFNLDVDPDTYIKHMDRTVTRDVFFPAAEHFPVAGGEGRLGGRSGDGFGFRRDAILKDGREMILESTLLSDPPQAIIAGQLVRIGDQINGFQVVEIQSRSVTLLKDGVRINLEMKQE